MCYAIKTPHVCALQAQAVPELAAHHYRAVGAPSGNAQVLMHNTQPTKKVSTFFGWCHLSHPRTEEELPQVMLKCSCTTHCQLRKRAYSLVWCDLSIHAAEELAQISPHQSVFPANLIAKCFPANLFAKCISVSQWEGVCHSLHIH